jgi:hypothetical protein
MNQRLLTLFLLFAGAVSLAAQHGQFGFGFRAGLDYSKLSGPSETGPNGEKLESYTNDKGFHIGGAITYKFSDLAGARFEFMFTQRGSKYEYSGPSYYVLGRKTVSSITLMGTRVQTQHINNAYFDFPLLAYYKIGKLEVFGGLNTGLMISSTGGGTINFTGVSNGKPVDPFQLSLDYNYKSDKAGEASVERTVIIVNGLTYPEPTYQGAYYEFDTRGKMQFKTLDMGLIAGLSYYINEGFFFSWRYIYGLGDVDRNQYDISLQTLNSNGTHVQRADSNRSLSMQFSVGFSF